MREPSSSGSTIRASPKTGRRARPKGKAEDVLKLLDARHLAPSKDQRQQVTSCTDAAQLNRWFDRAITAGTANEVFDD